MTGLGSASGFLLRLSEAAFEYETVVVVVAAFEGSAGLVSLGLWVVCTVPAAIDE